MSSVNWYNCTPSESIFKQVWIRMNIYGEGSEYRISYYSVHLTSGYSTLRKFWETWNNGSTFVRIRKIESAPVRIRFLRNPKFRLTPSKSLKITQRARTHTNFPKTMNSCSPSETHRSDRNWKSKIFTVPILSSNSSDIE